MTKKTALISENVFLHAESALKTLGREGRISNKLQAIIASYKHGIKHVAEILDISRASIHGWVKLFIEQGVDGLYHMGKPSRSKLTAEQQKVLKKWLEVTPALTLKELGIKIKKEFNLNIGKSSIHRTIISLGFSHITGRPRHHKSDGAKQEEFKKNFKN